MVLKMRGGGGVLETNNRHHSILKTKSEGLQNKMNWPTVCFVSRTNECTEMTELDFFQEGGEVFCLAVFGSFAILI